MACVHLKRRRADGNFLLPLERLVMRVQGKDSCGPAGAAGAGCINYYIHPYTPSARATPLRIPERLMNTASERKHIPLSV